MERLSNFTGSNIIISMRFVMGYYDLEISESFKYVNIKKNRIFEGLKAMCPLSKYSFETSYEIFDSKNLPKSKIKISLLPNCLTLRSISHYIKIWKHFPIKKKILSSYIFRSAYQFVETYLLPLIPYLPRKKNEIM